jgi:3'-phosphoadenosine 5'-phosphosulfate sulfotransferase (PAPS reductase)/FAD synthetase
VLLDIAAKVKPDIAVLFLDTGMLFGQTLDYRQQLAARLGLTNVRDLRPPTTTWPPATRRPSSGRPTPTPAATSARCCRWTARSASSTAG